MLHRPCSGNRTRSFGYYIDTAFPGPMEPGVALLDSGQAYLNFSTGTRAQREQVFAAFAPAGVSSADPAPPPLSPPLAASQSSDPVAQNALTNELPAFIQAYASGDSATRNGCAALGAELAGLGGAVTFDSIAGPHVPPGDATRPITATVIWQVPGPAESSVRKLEMSCGMSVVDLHSGKWYVNEISASTEAVGAK